MNGVQLLLDGPPTTADSEGHGAVALGNLPIGEAHSEKVRIELVPRDVVALQPFYVFCVSALTSEKRLTERDPFVKLVGELLARNAQLRFGFRCRVLWSPGGHATQRSETVVPLEPRQQAGALGLGHRHQRLGRLRQPGVANPDPSIRPGAPRRPRAASGSPPLSGREARIPPE